MNIGAITARKAGRASGLSGSNSHTPEFDQLRTAISRRQFARTAGTAVAGVAIGSRLWRPGQAVAKGTFTPVPIPGGSPALGGAFHVFGPAVFDPIDAEPATITNMNGFSGLAYITGMVTQSNVKTGEQLRFPFVDSDMRFMKGVFRGADRRVHVATFAFV